MDGDIKFDILQLPAFWYCIIITDTRIKQNPEFIEKTSSYDITTCFLAKYTGNLFFQKLVLFKIYGKADFLKK